MILRTFKHVGFFFIISLYVSANSYCQYIEISCEQLRDKIRGGLLGQILGNLNGLKHEMKYISEPGHVMDYIPALPDGAWTDDDTDFEWIYIKVMQDENTILHRFFISLRGEHCFQGGVRACCCYK